MSRWTALTRTPARRAFSYSLLLIAAVATPVYLWQSLTHRPNDIAGYVMAASLWAVALWQYSWMKRDERLSTSARR